ncbi:DNA ligase, partial [Paenibacillus chibensis]|nr:DNA ligase [Paenibacillus chibensis]
PAAELAAGHDPQARQLHAAASHAAAVSTSAAETAGVRTEHALQSPGTQDTLKGILLQLVNHDEAPPQLKEAAQQLISHLTGQQLLLNTDRTAPFAQMTMFLPLNGPDGQETASVQIQSRRGPKGELDASNCRLWFDLQMKHLGQTLVDVQVVDRIVSLKVHNDHEWAGELLEHHREDISGAMESIGYQLLTLKAEPMPQGAAATQGAATAAAVNEYVPQGYKGVDFRV